jgi:PAS domain-containing protein
VLRIWFDAIRQIGWTARADGFVDYYNPAWYAYTGTAYAEMKGDGEGNTFYCSLPAAGATARTKERHDQRR